VKNGTPFSSLTNAIDDRAALPDRAADALPEDHARDGSAALHAEIDQPRMLIEQRPRGLERIHDIVEQVRLLHRQRDERCACSPSRTQGELRMELLAALAFPDRLRRLGAATFARDVDAQRHRRLARKLVHHDRPRHHHQSDRVRRQLGLDVVRQLVVDVQREQRILSARLCPRRQRVRLQGIFVTRDVEGEGTVRRRGERSVEMQEMSFPGPSGFHRRLRAIDCEGSEPAASVSPEKISPPARTESPEVLRQ
jgi:hypothetical protein